LNVGLLQGTVWTSIENIHFSKVSRGRDRMVVGFTITYAISA